MPSPATDAVDAVTPAAWTALGTLVQLAVTDPERTDAATDLAGRVLDEVDRACSRFRPDSDLQRANAAAGRWTTVDPVLVGAVRAALWAAETSDGLVDPCLGRLVVAAGYDRTFAEVRSSSDPVALPLPLAGDAWRRIEVEPGRVRVPEGVALDLGATGKAFAADLVALTVAERLDLGVVVSVGGDVRAADPQGRPLDWPVDVAPDRAALADPDTPVCRVVLSSGGLATSSVTARRWVRGGRTWHHVLDPRTGEPALAHWRAATAYGRSAAAANMATTAALVLGPAAPAWLERAGIAARLVAADGTLVHTPAWAGTAQQTRLVPQARQSPQAQQEETA